jgi:hypothetical protein
VNHKPNAKTLLKALAAAATLGATTKLGYQLAVGTANPALIALTALAAILLGVVLADDIHRVLRTARAHRRAVNFRTRHGDPAGWDNNEYEAYFALTADQTPARRNIHPAA